MFLDKIKAAVRPETPALEVVSSVYHSESTTETDPKTTTLCWDAMADDRDYMVK